MADNEKLKAKIQKQNARQKALGYPGQKKYREAHRGEIYEPRLRIPSANRAKLDALLQQTGLTVTQLFAGAVYAQYGIDLTKE